MHDHPYSRTRIKICGLRQVEHVHAAVNAGADAIGLVFYPPSVRNLEIPAAQILRSEIPAFVSAVALFVNPSAELVRAVIARVRPDVLQFHGDEPEAFCAQFDRPYVKAAAAEIGLNLVDFRRRYPSASAILVDTPSAGFGGSGKAFDWSVLSKNASEDRLVLSGGLSFANVREAIATVRPYAVDVSSGVEAQKGIKDSAKIQQFCQAVRDADAVANSSLGNEEKEIV